MFLLTVVELVAWPLCLQVTQQHIYLLYYFSCLFLFVLWTVGHNSKCVTSLQSMSASPSVCSHTSGDCCGTAAPVPWPEWAGVLAALCDLPTPETQLQTVRAVLAPPSLSL